MLNIETTNTYRIEEIKKALNNSFSHCYANKNLNIQGVMEYLQENISNTLVGRGGSHIWIHDTTLNKRLATINI